MSRETTRGDVTSPVTVETDAPATQESLNPEMPKIHTLPDKPAVLGARTPVTAFPVKMTDGSGAKCPLIPCRCGGKGTILIGHYPEWSEIHCLSCDRIEFGRDEASARAKWNAR